MVHGLESMEMAVGQGYTNVKAPQKYSRALTLLTDESEPRPQQNECSFA